jgi:hypothetical protein
VEPINAVEAVELLSLEMHRHKVALERLTAALTELASKAGLEVANG